MRRLASVLLRPIVSACLASGLTALMLGGPPEVHTIERVTVVRPIPGTTKVVTVYRSSCDTRTVEKLLNAVADSSARTGAASLGNGSDTRVGSPLGGGAHATGDNAAAVSQYGEARSGDAILGQVIHTLNACGTVNINATNSVTDSVAKTGRASVDNDAEVAVGTELPGPSPSPTPEPETGDVAPIKPHEANSRFRSGAATPSPTPTPELLSSNQ